MKQFKAPTVAEVIDYCKTVNYGGDKKRFAEHFITYYKRKQWKEDGEIIDWRAWADVWMDAEKHFDELGIDYKNIPQRHGNWIKLDMELLDLFIQDKTQTVLLFTYLLLKSYTGHGEQKTFPVKKGQVLTTLHEIEEEVPMEQEQILFCLDNLTRDKFINKKASGSFMLITINNYDNYDVQG